MSSFSRPLVSFLVPCYNYGRFLPDCLASIFSQEGRYEFEVIAVDDGSTDDTQGVLRSFADPRLRVLTHPLNRGHVATVNEGFAEARGAFIGRIDPDDRYRPHFLSTMVEVLRRFPEVGLVYGDAALIDEQGAITAGRSDRIHGGRDFRGNELLTLLEENFICAPTALARREAWQRALPVPEGLAFNDWYLNVMLARRHEFYYVNRVVAEYRVHPANHHAKIVRDKSEEPSILRVLDRVFSETEPDAELERQKRRARGRIYAAQYLTLANKYFGLQQDNDARRCYLRAIYHRRLCFFRSGVARRLIGTLVGRSVYEGCKSCVRSVRPPFQPASLTGSGSCTRWDPSNEGS